MNLPKSYNSINAMYNYEVADSFIERSIIISKSKTREEAYEIIKKELDLLENKYLNECLAAFNYIQYEKCLDWIEENISKTKNITLSWGHLAAISKFNWRIAEKWIDSGRPLSLVALDAINFCTTKGEKLNMSVIMREIDPKIIDHPKYEIIAEKVQEYKIKDPSPRVKRIVDKIMENLFN
ncbi:hypothetical protein [Chryseobacterium salviniae]|uniref:DNA alkylation repair enzyme n=1 Tax=Chryseobacterium salviniae TaxID=3101750 RepID=A0ABU6HUV3_9FLAO|nr:hypothetical protein [Chryseobacterium sp. T9W2-O]MEC3876628.1 hypothetical protein [Chryseobacterium sp. T9W2-O]